MSAAHIFAEILLESPHIDAHGVHAGFDDPVHCLLFFSTPQEAVANGNLKLTVDIPSNSIDRFFQCPGEDHVWLPSPKPSCGQR